MRLRVTGIHVMPFIAFEIMWVAVMVFPSSAGWLGVACLVATALAAVRFEVAP